MIFEGVKFSQKCQNSAKTAPSMLFFAFFSVFPENFLGERGQPHWPVFEELEGKGGGASPLPLLTPILLVSAPDSMII